MKNKLNLLKTKLLLTAFLLTNIALFAQNEVVKGTVTSNADNGPIPGVSVVVDGTSNGTTTDFDGNFQLNAPSGSSVTFSFIGFVSKTISVDGQASYNVQLEEDSQELDEVVVVGYGSVKKSHLTGAVASVGGDDLAAVQAVRVDDALAGKLAGVLIQNSSSEPGAAPKIQVRAASSISGSSNPLVVVDGFPISGTLATVNAADIQSMEVLKDAASSAIYGSRGANGVILITTKKGKSGKTVVTYDGYTSFSSKYRDNINMTGSEWAAHSRSEIAAGNWQGTVDSVDPAFLEYRLSAYEQSPDEVSVEDWLYQTGVTQNHDLSMSGGSDDVNYFASVGYQDTEGIIRTQEYERINARLSVDAKLGKKVKAGLSFNGFAADRAIVGWDVRDLSRAYSVHPIYHTEASIAFVNELSQKAVDLGLDSFDTHKRTSDPNFNQSITTLVPGDYVHDWHYGRNNNGIGGSGDAGPAAKLDNSYRTQKTYFANLNAYLSYNITDALVLKTVAGTDINDTQDNYWRGLESDARTRSTATNLDEIGLKKSSGLSETTLSFNKEIGKHTVGAVAGYEIQKTNFTGVTLDATNIPYLGVTNYNLLEPADISVRERQESRVRTGLFTRLNYVYDDRFLASVSIRRDGDSRFGENNQYATFPAISLGWNLHNEAFLKDNSVISNLKLRLSSGSLGTTSFLGSYESLSLLNATTTVYGTGFGIPSDVANPDLTWQTNTETNYGINLGILNNRFTLGLDYYTSDINDILINQSVSTVNGTDAIKLNAGNVTSSGIEVEFGGRIIQTSDFTWDISANLSTVETEITDLNGLDELPREAAGQSGRDVIFRNRVGGQIGEMWALETAGQVEMTYLVDGSRNPNNTTGAYYVVDQQEPGEVGYGSIDATKTVEEGGDLVYSGQNTPDMYWGLNTSMNYKSFDLSMQFQGANGAEVFNVDPYYYGSQWGGRLVSSFDADGDNKADHNGMFVKGAKDNLDANIQDASYVALRNLTIGYTFDQSAAKKIGLSSVRVYGAASNLLYVMADNYTSYNPEGIETTGDYSGPTTSGFQVGASPIARSFTLGLNLKF